MLSLTRTSYLALCNAFPLSAKIMLDNLLRCAQQVRLAARGRGVCCASGPCIIPPSPMVHN